MRKNRPIPFISKPKFALVVDGDCEFWYINMLKRNEKSISVDLKPEIPQRKKLSDQYKKVIELSNDYDKVFWVIDFDVINSETRIAKKGAKTALQEFKEYHNNLKEGYDNVEIIINNPCLEYWILLHFETTTKYYDTCEDATKQLKKHLPGYEKTQAFYTKQDNDIYLKLKPILNIGLSNTKKFKDFDFDNPHSGLSQMNLFFETKEISKIFESI